MRKPVFFLILLLTTANVFSQSRENIEKKFAIVTYVSDNEQEKSVKALIKSVRELTGNYRDCEIYVVLGDPDNFPGAALKGKNVKLLPLKMNKAFLEYPLAFKAFAAAQVERIVKTQTESLVWLDPGVIVLNSPDALMLDKNTDVAVRPVTLSNTISISPGERPNAYWAPIYRKTGLNYKELPVLTTIVDDVPIQPYYNCEVYSVNPKLGICEEWAGILTDLLNDEEYQSTACTTFLNKLFLHQAVLSGVITSKVPQGRIKPLPISSGYPFNQHERLAPEKQIASLNELSVVIFDYAWAMIPNWMNTIPTNEPLRQWLFDTYLDYLKLGDHLYRMEGSCNSYLITTKKGSVLIDPAGASAAPEYFKSILENCPLKAILLTHAHRDHWDNMEIWQTDPPVPIIAQREFITYNEYWGRLAPFFARRSAIWGRKPLPDSSEIQAFNPVVPTITFADEYTYKLGGFHFEMVHTPGETPDHATIWIPELSAVFVGDNYYEYFINNATLRGTLTRPVLGYIRALDLALSYKPEYFLMGHGSALVSKNSINETVGNFRNALQYIYDETIGGINDGKDVYTLMQEIILPDTYKIRPYFGSVKWTVRG
ncbi:MAG: MBL fold metallo-hydrolase, partial [Candidatus Marinimicrobia bacterium]|nr:MBL fold metallo-hydrolase [Candidatus Neomarinimicrobiota bacterium]